MDVGICCTDHTTPLYPQKLALTSPTSGGRSVGIVHSQSKAKELIIIIIIIVITVSNVTVINDFDQCTVLNFRIAELHPALAEAANHIAAAVHEEAATGNASSQGSSSGYSYSLEALSDEEEMDSSQVRGKLAVVLFE
jgi:hypothetical protein